MADAAKSDAAKKLDLTATLLDWGKSAVILGGLSEFRDSLSVGAEIAGDQAGELYNKVRAFLFRTLPFAEYVANRKVVWYTAGVMLLALGWIAFAYRIGPWFLPWLGTYLVLTAGLLIFLHSFHLVEAARVTARVEAHDREYRGIRDGGAKLFNEAKRLRELLAATSPAPSPARRTELEAELRKAEREAESYREALAMLDRADRDSDEFIVFLLPWARSHIEVVRLGLRIEELNAEITAMGTTHPNWAARTLERNDLNRTREDLILARARDERGASMARRARNVAQEQDRQTRRYFDPNSPSGWPLVQTIATCIYLLSVGTMLVWLGIYLQSQPASILTDTLLGYIHANGNAQEMRASMPNYGVLPLFTFPLKLCGALVFWMVYGITKTMTYVVKFVTDLMDMVHQGVRGIAEQTVGNAFPFVEAEDFKKFHAMITGSKLLQLFLEEGLQAFTLVAFGTAISSLLIPTLYGDTLLLYGFSVGALDGFRSVPAIASPAWWAPVMYVAVLFTGNMLIWIAFKVVLVKKGHDYLLESQKQLAVPVAILFVLLSGLVIFYPVTSILVHVLSGASGLHFIAGIMFLAVLWAVVAVTEGIQEKIHPHVKTSTVMFASVLTAVFVVAQMWAFYRWVDPTPVVVVATRPSAAAPAPSVAPSVAPSAIPAVPTISELFADARTYLRDRRSTASAQSTPKPPPPPPPPAAGTVAARTRRVRTASADPEYDAALARVRELARQ